jgi:hypothetical protein
VAAAEAEVQLNGVGKFGTGNDVFENFLDIIYSSQYLPSFIGSRGGQVGVNASTTHIKSSSASNGSRLVDGE